MRNIAHIILLSTLILSSFNINNHPTSKNKTSAPAFVTFSLDNPADSKSRLDFYYHDSLAYGHPVVITGNGSKLFLNAPTFLFEASDKQTPFFIYPGETVNIKYAGTDSVRFYIHGNGQRSNELDFFRQLVQKTGNVYYGFKVMPYLKKESNLNDIHASEKEINKVKDSRLRFLAIYKQRHPVSEGFANIATGSIKSIALNDSLILYYNNRDLLNQQNLYKPMLTEKIPSVAAIGFMPYQFFLRPCTMLVSLITSNNPNNSIASNKELVKHLILLNKTLSQVRRIF